MKIYVRLNYYFIGLHTPNAKFFSNMLIIYTLSSILTKKNDHITDIEAFTLVNCEWKEQRFTHSFSCVKFLCLEMKSDRVKFLRNFMSAFYFKTANNRYILHIHCEQNFCIASSSVRACQFFTPLFLVLRNFFTTWSVHVAHVTRQWLSISNFKYNFVLSGEVMSFAMLEALLFSC